MKCGHSLADADVDIYILDVDVKTTTVAPPEEAEERNLITVNRGQHMTKQSV